MSILLYALEVCALDEIYVQPLDFTINRFFMKLFRTSKIVTVCECQSLFGVDLPSIVLINLLLNMAICLVAACCTTAMLS